jgi:hypothetical protein
MTDYYTLIAKAVTGLEKSTGEARRGLYDRARSALVAQLRGVTPALSESDITREWSSLEEAIRKVETEAARRSRTDPAPRAAPPPPPPTRPARPNMPEPPAPWQPSVEAVEMRSAPLAGGAAPAAQNVRATSGGAAMEPPPSSQFERAEPRLEAEPVRPSARRPTPRDAERVLAGPSAPEPVRAREAREPRRPRDPEAPPPSSRRLEPPPPPPFLDTPDAEKPPDKKSRFVALPLRKIAIWSLVGPIALSVVGFLIWKPPTSIIGWFRSAPSLPQTADIRDTTAARPKIADRIGSPSADEGTLVAQRAVLYEEDPNDPAGKRYVGSAVWRTELVPPAPGQAPDLAIRADIEIPEQKISARWALRRNDDKALPASHTVELMFTLPPDFPHGGITNIPGVLMKQSESTRGVPLAGLAVKVTNNFFLMGLSSADADRARNIQLLKEGAWFDIPVVYNDGRRTIIALEKGTPGDRAFARAFEAWGQ